MVGSAALGVALRLAERPAAVKYVRGAPLPDGVALLLQVAAEQADALRAAQAMTGCPQVALQASARFFIEQVMLHTGANSYRVLGASPGATRGELRRNMALLIKWLHPDCEHRRASQSDLDRGAFILRVTQAWENLKTDERQAAYDRSLSDRRKKRPSSSAARSCAVDGESCRTDRPGRTASSQAKQRPDGQRRQRLVVYRFERDTLWIRLLTHLWARP